LTKRISATEHDINNRNRKETRQYAPQIWWTLVQERLRTVGEVLPPPYIFALGDTASLTACAWTLYNRQQANFSTLCSGTSSQSRTTECHASSRKALPCNLFIYYTSERSSLPSLFPSRTYNHT